MEEGVESRICCDQGKTGIWTEAFQIIQGSEIIQTCIGRHGSISMTNVESCLFLLVFKFQLFPLPLHLFVY